MPCDTRALIPGSDYRSPNYPGAVRIWESAAMYPLFLTVPHDAE